MIKDIKDRAKLQSMYLEVYAYGLNKKYKKLYNCLQEIKEIAEDAYGNDSKYQATGVYNEILQKIAESEGKNDNQ